MTHHHFCLCHMKSEKNVNLVTNVRTVLFEQITPPHPSSLPKKQDNIMKSAKYTSANPLFEKWLIEWRDQAAIQRNETLQHCFTKAVSSLRNHPSLINRGKDCRSLKYFGPKLCAMLDKRLNQYLNSNLNENIDLPITSLIDEPSCSISKKSKKDDNSRSNHSPNEKSSERAFIPKSRSASYALLIALYRKSESPDYIGFMTKAELLKEAQPFSDCSMKTAENDPYHTGWSSMSTLMKKGLVSKRSSPAKYSLTDSGIILARALSEKEDLQINDASLGTSIAIESDLLVSKPREYVLSAFALNSFNTIDLKETFPRAKVTMNGELKVIDSTTFTSTAKISTTSEELEVIDLDNYEELETRKVEMRKFNRRNNTWPRGKNYKTSAENLIKASAENVNLKQKEADRTKEINIDSDPVVIFEPHSFDVILLVDTQETSGYFIERKAKRKDDATIAELNQFNVQFEVRHLKVGDFAWVARRKETNYELILPHIVERKRIDDLDKSIQDGRFREQKFRLKQSGIKNLIYMVESYGKNQHTTIPLKSLLQAAVNSLVQDGFIVKFTESHKSSIMYLSVLTDLLKKKYLGKYLTSSEKEGVDSVNIIHNSESLMKFTTFNKSSAKVKILKVKEMLVRQLLQIKGISLDKALAIVDLYSTPMRLFSTLEKIGQNGERLFAPLQYGLAKRQIGPVSSKIIYQLYTKRVLS